MRVRFQLGVLLIGQPGTMVDVGAELPARSCIPEARVVFEQLDAWQVQLTIRKRFQVRIIVKITPPDQGRPARVLFPQASRPGTCVLSQVTPAVVGVKGNPDLALRIAGIADLCILLG
jgi:hypothetical protein